VREIDEPGLALQEIDNAHFTVQFDVERGGASPRGWTRSPVSNKYWGNTNWTTASYYTDNVPDWHPAMDQTWQETVGMLVNGPVLDGKKSLYDAR
jgi:hypothetical protein